MSIQQFPEFNKNFVTTKQQDLSISVSNTPKSQTSLEQRLDTRSSHPQPYTNSSGFYQQGKLSHVPVQVNERELKHIGEPEVRSAMSALEDGFKRLISQTQGISIEDTVKDPVKAFQHNAAAGQWSHLFQFVGKVYKMYQEMNKRAISQA